MNQDKPEAPKSTPPLKTDQKIETHTPKLKPPPAGEKPKADKPVKAPKKKPGKMTVALRWFFILVIVFGLGIVLTLFALYLPARQELTRTSSGLSQAESEYKSSLQEANQEIERLSALETKNKALQETVDQSNLYITLLQARVDVLTAQTAVNAGDYSKASLALSKTGDRLDDLASLLPNDQRESIDALQTRLNLALGEIEKSDSAAGSDLEVLATKLLELEDAIIR